MKFETLAIHAGQQPDAATGAIVVPVYQTATFTQDAIGQDRGFVYSRSGNPTRSALESCVAALEGARFGLAYASGMAAIAGTMQLVRAGDHVVVADDLYGGSHRLFSKILPNYGVRFTYVDATQLETVAKAIEPATRMVWIESPTNPMLRLIDVAACAEIARQRGAWLVVDNTFATPYLQNPIALGAHVVVHSTTKYLGGHSDVIGGAVVVDDAALHESLRFAQQRDGRRAGAVGRVAHAARCQDAGGADAPARRERAARRRSAARSPATRGRPLPGLRRSIRVTSSRAGRCAASAAW